MAHFRQANPWDAFPFVGGALQKVGIANEIGMMPCNPDPFMWVKGAFQATPYLVWSLACPEPLDAKFLTIQGPAKGKRTHRLNRRFRMKNAGLLPASVFDNAGRIALWRLGALAQRIGFYFIIIDAVPDFLINWSTLTMEYAGCLAGQKTSCTGGPSLPGVIWPANEWHLKLWTMTYDPLGAYSGGSFTLPGDTGWQCMLNFKIDRTGADPASGTTIVKWRLWDETENHALSEFVFTACEPGEVKETIGTAAVYRFNDDDRQITPQIFVTGPNADITGTEITFYRSHSENLNILASDCWDEAPF